MPSSPRFILPTLFALALGAQTAKAASTTVPQISIKDAHVKEGNAGLTPMLFSIGLTKTPTSEISVTYQTLGRTASSTTDFVTAKGTITFAAGEKTKTLTVLVHGDTKAEANETFLVKLLTSKGATFRDAEATGTIINDDGDPKPAPGSGKLAFTSTTPGIFVMNSDGTNRTQVTTGPNDGYPTWSPDGKKIAFLVSNSSGTNYGLSVIDADGSNLRVVTSPGENNSIYQPRWSSDSKALIYNDFNTFNEGLIRKPINGGAATVLTTNNSDYLPTCSITGNKISFSSYDSASNGYQLYTIDGDGSNRKQLTNDNENYVSAPAISANGKSIVFLKTNYAFHGMYAINSDGTNERLLLEGTIETGIGNPVVSDDGKKSVFLLYTPYDENFERKVSFYEADLSSNVVNELQIDGIYPDFGPDSKTIAYTSPKTGRYQVYIIKTDGTKEKQITQSTFNDYNADFVTGTVPVPKNSSAIAAVKAPASAPVKSANGS